LVQHYETARLSVSHFDLYRITTEAELDELGFDDALANGAALIEWPERAPHRIPADALHVNLVAVGESARHATLSGPQRWADILVSEAAHVR
jgi:tRNA threonylcarbamoyl adenosine modification protein YjeE